VNLLHYHYKTLTSTSIPLLFLVFLLSCLSPYKMSQKPFLRSGDVREDHQSAQAIFLEIKKAIQSATKESFLVYQGIDEETGSCVERSLDEDKDVEERNSRVCYNSCSLILHVSIMPGFIHDSHQPWLEIQKGRMLQTGFITFDEFACLRLYHGTTVRGFDPPYAASSKQPDQMILPPGLNMPTLAVEAGWSEATTKLKADMRLWIRGGAVNIVLLFKWSKLVGGRVTGWVEVYEPGPGGERLIQSETLFPVPLNPQKITVTRGQLFGRAIPPGRHPLDTFDLSLDDLRPIASEGMQKDGYRPA